MSIWSRNRIVCVFNNDTIGITIHLEWDSLTRSESIEIVLHVVFRIHITEYYFLSNVRLRSLSARGVL